MPTKIPFNLVKEKAIIKHNGFYNYDKISDYLKQDLIYTITCPIHGDFYQKFSSHLEGKGCPKCGEDKKSNFDLNKFKLEASLIHNNYYDYTESSYKNRHVTIKCPAHGNLNVRVDGHLKGVRCFKCSKEKLAHEKRLTVEQIKAKFFSLWGSKYDYSLVKDVKADKKPKYTIVCPVHGSFEKRVDLKLTDKGCSKCAYIERSEKSTLKQDFVIERSDKVHIGKYDYSLYEYTGSDNLVKIICKEHGLFEKSASNHASGVGCPKCFIPSKQELVIKSFISEFIEIEHRNRKILKNNSELDFYIKDLNLAIEYNGVYYHSDKFKKDTYHLNKTIQCQENGIKLIHVFEDEWVFKKNIVKSRLLNIIGKTPNKIFARNCIVKEVGSSEAMSFLDVNHLQGKIGSKLKLGLYYNNELASIMTFGELRKTLGCIKKEGSWELLRFCNKLNTNVVGGASKLLKYFENNYLWQDVVSYADLRWSEGELYKSLNFELEHQSKPNYFYTKGVSRENRFKYRKDILVKEGFDKNKTEKQIMQERGFYRIYDCGTLKFKKINQK